jgi:carboxymethylenebutenolidase
MTKLKVTLSEGKAMTTPAAHDVETRTLMLAVPDGTAMPAFLARPAGPTPRPGVLVFQEAFGVNRHIRDVTERLARAGYAALAPALFHRTGAAFEGAYGDFGAVRPHMQALTDAGLAADTRAAYGWLTADDGGRAAAVGAVGFCMGGRVSFLAAAELPLRAAVSYYGGGIAPAPQGFFPSLLPRARDLHAPVLLFWGGRDTHIGIDQTRAVEDALRAAGKTYAQVTFSDAGHGFFCDERASYESDTARQSWALTLAFFESYLRA